MGLGPYGRGLKSEPRRKDGRVRYGFSGEGRVLLSEKYTSITDQFYETFLEYEPQGIWVDRYSYEPEKPPVASELHVYEGGQIRQSVVVARYGTRIWDYCYENGRLSQVAERWESVDLPEQESVYTLSHDDEGLEAVLLEEVGGARELRYVRQRPRVSADRTPGLQGPGAPRALARPTAYTRIQGE
jgi:hypothetical protein